MGRITIFVADSCTDSFRTITTIRDLKLPYTIINVTKHPHKRKDMMSLSMKLSTPQVFFNTRHIGGAKETIALLQHWDEASNRGSCDFTVSSDTSSISELSFRMSPMKSSRKKSIKPNKVMPTIPIPQTNYGSVYERYVDEVGNHHDPVDPRFAVPVNGAEVPESVHVRDAAAECCFKLPNGTKATVLEMTEMLKDIIEHNKSNEVGGVVYSRSFFGRRLTSGLMDFFEVSKTDSTKLAEALLRQGVICPVQNNLESTSFYHKYLYRLKCHDSPDVLNSYRVWTETTDPDPLRLINKLIKMMQIIELEVTDSYGHKNIAEALRMFEFRVFEEAICELQKIQLQDLDDTAALDCDENKLKAFAINVYNLMIKYARIKVGVPEPKDTAARKSFYASIKFNIGGHLYSFNDWEHGVLRGNAKSPQGSPPPFGHKDPRYDFVVQSPDARIHFALDRGVSGSPAMYTYTAEWLDMELDIAAATFCENKRNVMFDEATRELHVSKIFRWYLMDFVTRESELPQVIAHYMKRAKKHKLHRFLQSCSKQVTVRYLPFDWSAAERDISQAFNMESLKMQTSRRRGLLG